MNRPTIFAYQMLTGLSDASTGALLIIAPVFTLRLMGLHAPTDSLPFLSFIGTFVLSVGLSCLYGAFLIARCASAPRLEMVWLLTAFTRSGVAIFIATQILTQTLEAGWITVALSDGACVLIQAIGLRKGWLAHAAR
jgi:hypothetical protein